jgi:hypothetical protein
MRQLQNNEINAVSGAGLLTSAVKTGAQAGAAAGQGLVAAGKGLFQAGSILAAPLVAGGKAVIRILI